jgi:hypothetical protein
VVKVDTSEFTPALDNDPALTRRTVEVFQRVLGAEKVATGSHQVDSGGLRKQIT